jgi:hypothetical protein
MEERFDASDLNAAVALVGTPAMAALVSKANIAYHGDAIPNGTVLRIGNQLSVYGAAGSTLTPVKGNRKQRRKAASKARKAL